MRRQIRRRNVTAVVDNGVQIDQASELVFDCLLSDIRNELEWKRDMKLVNKLADGPIGFGKERSNVCIPLRFDRVTLEITASNSELAPRGSFTGMLQMRLNVSFQNRPVLKDYARIE
jgi:hypothetical protein